MLKSKDNITSVTYNMGKVFIPEGFYTEEEIENILKCKKGREKALKDSMRKI